MKPKCNSILAASLLIFLVAGQVLAQTPPADTNTPPPAGTNSVAPSELESTGSESHRFNDRPVILTDFILGGDRTNYGDIVVIKGNSTINGRMEGNSVTIMGNSRINGHVTRDLYVIMGSADLGPDAVVDGDAVVIGGKLTLKPGAKIVGEITEQPIPGSQGLTDWITDGLLLGRPLPPSVGWARNVAGVFLLMNLLLLLLFPKPIQACVDTMERRPIGSLFAGLLVKLLVGLVCLLLIFTVVGVLVVPFLIAGFVVSFLFGKITIYRYVGQQLGRQLNVTFLQGPVISLLIGTLIFYLLYSVPFLGFVAWGFTGIFGIGAVGMTLFDTYRAERKKNAPPPPAPPSPSAPAPTPSCVSPVASTEGAAGMTMSTLSGDPTLAFASAAAAEPAAAIPTGGPGFMPPYTPPSPTLPPVSSNLEVGIEVRAGFWIRLCALALDFFLFMVPIMFMRREPNPEPVMIVWLIYHVGLWTWKGTTVGGIVTGLKVVRLDGRRLNLGVALIRALASVFSAFVLGLGFIWTAFSADKQSWHDKIAGTVIIKVPKGMSLI